MFLGFLSNRTFTGFCRSYMRYCVRSYVRNCLIYDEKMAAAAAADAHYRATHPFAIPYLGESPEDVVNRIAPQVKRQAIRRGWSDQYTSDRAVRLCEEAFAEMEKIRGLPPGTYKAGYGNAAVRNHRGGPIGGEGGVNEGGSSGGWTGKTVRPAGNPPAVKRNGGLRGGATRRWR